MKAGIYIGKDKKGNTLLIKIYGEEPFLKVDYWDTGVIDGNLIITNANSKQIEKIDWDNVKLIEE